MKNVKELNPTELQKISGGGAQWITWPFKVAGSAWKNRTTISKGFHQGLNQWR